MPRMSVVAHGIDLVEIERIERMEREHAERFIDRCFSLAERDGADERPKRRHEFLAGRFAAKEAVLKALGSGWSGGIRWTDVEVVNERSGRPVVRLEGEAARIAAQQGVTEWVISISHTAGLAMASVIGLGDSST